MSEFRYQILHYIISFSVRKNQFYITTPATLKGILKTCSRFCHSFSNFSGLLSHSFLYNHIAATLPFLNFCSSEWFFFWEIVQTISLFLKFRGRNFYVTPSELFINPLRKNQHFVEVKTFEAGRNIPKQPFLFLKIDNKTFLMQTLTYTLINFWPEMNNEPNWYIW